MATAVLTISSKNYSSWSLRGWLLCKMAGLEFEEEVLSSDDPSTRAELLLLSPSFLVPCLRHDGAKVWDTLAIAEYLAEIAPKRACCPRIHSSRPLPRGLRRDAFGLPQLALGAAHEPQGALSGLLGVVGRARGYRTGRVPSGGSASTHTAARTCSASRRSPTQCMRPYARAS